MTVGGVLEAAWGLKVVSRLQTSCAAPCHRLPGVVDEGKGLDYLLVLPGTPRGHRKLLENFVQLKSDNKLLAEENARLEAELAEVQHARGGITTVPVPGQHHSCPPASPLPHSVT